ncbi:MAG: HNH endonuclease [Verrucomicrobiota bacterium]
MAGPGSFTKNFGWGSENFERLHHAIRQGFEGRLTTVQRQTWRERNADLGNDLPLVALNFFLKNEGNLVLPDELVAVAVREEHTTLLDGLAFFALNLSAVGRPPRTDSRPSPWASEFIKESLWQDGEWRCPADPSDLIYDAVANNADTRTEDSRIKVRNNYRWIFKIARRWQTQDLDSGEWIINSGYNEWLPNAVFLTWDRLAPDGATVDDLRQVLRTEEVHKLAGCPEEIVDDLSEEAAERYLEVGALSRFESVQDVRPPTRRRGSQQAQGPARRRELPDEPAPPNTAAEYLGPIGPAPRRPAPPGSTAVRDRSIVTEIKAAYGHRCAICGLQLHIGGGRFHTEGAHIVPLGSPHNGPDTIENLIPLCPNHHKQFDEGAIGITPDGRVFQKLPDGSIEAANPPQISFHHPRETPIGSNFLTWHFERHLGEIPRAAN